jgi:hypothetical protein
MTQNTHLHLQVDAYLPAHWYIGVAVRFLLLTAVPHDIDSRVYQDIDMMVMMMMMSSNIPLFFITLHTVRTTNTSSSLYRVIHGTDFGFVVSHLKPILLSLENLSLVITMVHFLPEIIALYAFLWEET